MATLADLGSKFFLDLRVSRYLSATTKIALCHDKRVFTVMHVRGCGSVLQIRGLLCHQGWENEGGWGVFWSVWARNRASPSCQRRTLMASYVTNKEVENHVPCYVGGKY